MPARSNPFQQVVALLHKQFPNAVVTESKLLLDRPTGQMREVDVVVESTVDDYTVVVSVECLDHARRATVEWVERMHGKHAFLATNKLVLVSRRGFTKIAVQKARAFGHEAIALDEAAKFDWTAIVGKRSKLQFESVTFDYEVDLVADSADGLEVLKPPPDLVLNEEDTERHLVVGPFVERILRMPEMGAVALDHLRHVGADGGPYWTAIDFPNGMIFMGPAGDIRKARRLRIGLTAKKQDFEVSITGGGLRGTPVAFGETQAPGAPTRVAVVEKPGMKPVVEVTQLNDGKWITFVNADEKTPGTQMTRHWESSSGE